MSRFQPIVVDSFVALQDHARRDPLARADGGRLTFYRHSVRAGVDVQVALSLNK